MTAETPITMPSTVKKVRFLLRRKSFREDLMRVKKGMNIFVGTGLKPVPTEFNQSDKDCFCYSIIAKKRF